MPWSVLMDQVSKDKAQIVNSPLVLKVNPWSEYVILLSSKPHLLFTDFKMADFNPLFFWRLNIILGSAFFVLRV